MDANGSNDGDARVNESGAVETIRLTLQRG